MLSIEEKKAKQAAYGKQYRQDNKERIREKNRRWRLANREKVLEYRKREYQKNKAANYARRAKRRSLKLKATLPSSCPKAIQLFYDEAQEISNILGIKMHVDHIRPLSKGGAHHQDNLQVITWCENLSKSSNWDGVSGKGIDD